MLKEAAASTALKLFAVTDGNHGRAVAHIGGLFGIPTETFVPRTLSPTTIQFIKCNGAQATTVDGSYDGAVEVVTKAAEAASDGSEILVQDTGFPGYENIPKFSTI